MTLVQRITAAAVLLGIAGWPAVLIEHHDLTVEYDLVRLNLRPGGA
jgi:hypothetical protein